ncbi:MAG: SMI1/KNR4 family protein [Planctomycetota bacterium]|jgi:hypothetical protein
MNNTGVWRPASPAPETALWQLVADAPVPLPDSYLDQLRTSNGGEGNLAVEPGWVVFWPAEEVIVNNREYQVSEYLPGFFAFGSNGGGELLAFDCRQAPPFSVVMVPFIPMEQKEAVQVAKNFNEFRQAIGCRITRRSS